MTQRDTPPTSAHADKKIPPESARALAAYNVYESLEPPRTYAKVVQKYGKGSNYVRQIEKWAGWYGWHDRILAWEKTQLETRRKKRLAEVERMDEEQAAVGHAYMVRALSRIDELIKEGTLPAAVAVSLLKISYEMERIARGAATARLEASGPDGGPFVIGGQVGFYPVLLPEKDKPPDAIEQGEES